MVAARKTAACQLRRGQESVVGPRDRPALGHNLPCRLVIHIGKTDVVPDRCAVAGRRPDSPLLLGGVECRIGVEIVGVEVGDLIDMDVVRGEALDRLARHGAAEAVADEVVGERVLGAERGEHEAQIDHRGEEGIA